MPTGEKSKPAPPAATPAATCPPGSAVPCPAAAPTGGVKWEKQPGASDADLAKAKQQWADAKARRLPDGSKPDTVKAMEALEASGKTTTIKVGPNGNEAVAADWTKAADPTKGSDSTINFDPNKAGSLGGGVTRDPESSLAHEAYHSYEISEGKLTSGADLQKNAEVNATAAENQHRAAKGLPQRATYGPWPVPQYTPPPTPTP